MGTNFKLLKTFTKYGKRYQVVAVSLGYDEARREYSRLSTKHDTLNPKSKKQVMAYYDTKNEVYYIGIRNR